MIVQFQHILLPAGKHEATIAESFSNRREFSPAAKRPANAAARGRIAVLLAALCLAPMAATAQDDNPPPMPRPHPERVPPDIGGPPGAAFAPELDPAAQEAFDLVLLGDDGQPLPPVDVTLTALLATDGRPVDSGVHWRVFQGDIDDNGTYPMVADIEGGTASVSLVPGRYFLHAMYGWAGATTQLIVTPDRRDQTVILNAGGLRLEAMINEEQAIDPNDLRFEIRSVDPESGELVLIADDIRQDEVLALTAGRYHIVSYYGETNAVVRADIDVQAGELTDLTLYHNAAEVTLKLVAARGGEALANTAWSVMTEGGEILFDSIGAFPTVILAEGEYIAIARHDDIIFEDTFAIEAGRNRDVEVLADNPVEAAEIPINPGDPVLEAAGP